MTTLNPYNLVDIFQQTTHMRKPMRKIKFRAFVGQTMLPVTNIDYIEDDSGTIVHIHVKGINQEIPAGTFELMQYTGLKDRDNIDIYEGDIVEKGRERCLVSFNNDNYGGVYGWNLLTYQRVPPQLRHQRFCSPPAYTVASHPISALSPTPQSPADSSVPLEVGEAEWISAIENDGSMPVYEYHFGHSPNEHWKIVGNIFEGIIKKNETEPITTGE